jgi:hypothetical protein
MKILGRLCRLPIMIFGYLSLAESYGIVMAIAALLAFIAGDILISLAIQDETMAVIAAALTGPSGPPDKNEKNNE